MFDTIDDIILINSINSYPRYRILLLIISRISVRNMFIYLRRNGSINGNRREQY